MYNEVGKKIKTVASVFAWLNILGSFVNSFFVYYLLKATIFADKYDLWNDRTTKNDSPIPLVAAVMAFFLGFIIAWMGHAILYGYGELIDQTCEINAKLAGAGVNDIPAPPTTTTNTTSAAINAINTVPDPVLVSDVPAADPVDVPVDTPADTPEGATIDPDQASEPTSEPVVEPVVETVPISVNIRCTNCGKVFNKQVNFCNGCGSALPIITHPEN